MISPEQESQTSELETEGDDWNNNVPDDYNPHSMDTHTQDGGNDYKNLIKKLMKENKKLKGKLSNSKSKKSKKSSKKDDSTDISISLEEDGLANNNVHNKKRMLVLLLAFMITLIVLSIVGLKNVAGIQSGMMQILCFSGKIQKNM